MSSANIHIDSAKLSAFSLAQLMEGHELMKLGDPLNVSAGLVAGAIVLAASVQAAPVAPILGRATVPVAANVEPTVVSQNEVDQIKPVQVHWHHHHHWHHRHWHHRHW